MNYLRSMTAAALLLCFAAVQAHTHLESSTPADQAVLASAPTEMMLHFSSPARLTSLSIQKEGDKEQKSIAPLPKTASAAIKVPLAPLPPGKYTVSWRAVGGDNHVMNGELHFSVQGKSIEPGA